MAEKISEYAALFNLLEDTQDLEGRLKILKETFPDMKLMQTVRDKEGIKAILGQIKEHSKKSHQQFRQNCA